MGERDSSAEYLTFLLAVQYMQIRPSWLSNQTANRNRTRTNRSFQELCNQRKEIEEPNRSKGPNPLPKKGPVKKEQCVAGLLAVMQMHKD